MQGGNSLVKLLSALASLIRRNRPVLRCNHVIFYFYNILDDACLYFISAVLLSNYYHNITQGTTVIHLYFDVVFLLVLYVNVLVVFFFYDNRASLEMNMSHFSTKPILSPYAIPLIGIGGDGGTKKKSLGADEVLKRRRRRR